MPSISYGGAHGLRLPPHAGFEGWARGSRMASSTWSFAAWLGRRHDDGFARAHALPSDKLAGGPSIHVTTGDGFRGVVLQNGLSLPDPNSEGGTAFGIAPRPPVSQLSPLSGPSRAAEGS